MMAVGLMTEDGNVYDGAHTGVNCTDVFKAQFSYNAAVFLQGAAFMYSFVGSFFHPRPVAVDYPRANQTD